MKRYELVKAGTHYVRMGEINNDVPSPGELVAEAEQELTTSMKNIPPWMTACEAHQYDRKAMALALRDARRQGWRFKKVSVLLTTLEIAQSVGYTEEEARNINKHMAAACGGCGGWTPMGGMSQFADGTLGCVCGSSNPWKREEDGKLVRWHGDDEGGLALDREIADRTYAGQDKPVTCGACGGPAFYKDTIGSEKCTLCGAVNTGAGWQTS